MNSKFKKIPAPQGVPLPKNSPYDVVILPERVTEDGVGIYSSGSMDAMKELREDGINVGYLHDADKRNWISRHSFQDRAIEFVIALLAEASWATIVHFLGKLKPNAHVKGTVVRYEKTESGETWEWYELEGTAADVIKILDDPASRKTPLV